MTRTVLTQLIKSKGGRITHTTTNHANYEIPLPEAEFIAFRACIPYLTVWHTQIGRMQRFGVFFDELKD